MATDERGLISGSNQRKKLSRSRCRSQVRDGKEVSEEALFRSLNLQYCVLDVPVAFLVSY